MVLKYTVWQADCWWGYSSKIKLIYTLKGNSSSKNVTLLGVFFPTTAAPFERKKAECYTRSNSRLSYPPLIIFNMSLSQLFWKKWTSGYVKASTPGLQLWGESASQLACQNDFTDFACRPTGSSLKSYGPVTRAGPAAQKELTRRDQSCGNITEAQRFDHVPTPRLNS